MCNQWVSVEERLPEVDLEYGSPDDPAYLSDDVLVYLGGEAHILMCVCWYNYKDECWKYDVEDSIEEFPYSEYITHWQPLPKLPTGA